MIDGFAEMKSFCRRLALDDFLFDLMKRMRLGISCHSTYICSMQRLDVLGIHRSAVSMMFGLAYMLEYVGHIWNILEWMFSNSH